jgi:DNA-binding winged helix-turn-helix (wHTH) protein
MAIPAESDTHVRFGEFKLDLRTRELCSNGNTSYLQEQPFHVLAALLDRPGQLVTRDELMKQLWPSDTFVDFDQSLNKAVNRLREALDDSADYPRFIETVPRRGYRFIGPIAPCREPTEKDDHPLVEKQRGLHRKILVSATVLLIAALVAGGFRWRSRHLEKLTERDTIVLADFANSTGDAVFDDTLKTALNVSLRQSPFLNLLPDSEVAKTLQQMTRPASTKLTPEVARELCLRADSKVYIAGSIGSLGSEYVLGL